MSFMHKLIMNMLMILFKSLYSVEYLGNITNMTDHSEKGPSDTALYLGGIIMFMALLCGLFGNFLVMIVIFTKRDLNNIINIFIISLCINDIINLGFNNSLVLT
jgi:hypothetical protein